LLLSFSTFSVPCFRPQCNAALMSLVNISTGQRAATPPTRQRMMSGSRPRGSSVVVEPPTPSPNTISQTAGLSVYFSLSNFSLFIFHPYGGVSMSGRKTSQVFKSEFTAAYFYYLSILKFYLYFMYSIILYLVYSMIIYTSIISIFYCYIYSSYIYDLYVL